MDAPEPRSGGPEKPGGVAAQAIGAEAADQAPGAIWIRSAAAGYGSLTQLPRQTRRRSTCSTG